MGRRKVTFFTRKWNRREAITKDKLTALAEKSEGMK